VSGVSTPGDAVTMQNARKEACVHGHEFTPENTRMRADGTRECRECRRIRKRAARTAPVAEDSEPSGGSA